MVATEHIVDSLIEKVENDEGIISIRSRFGEKYDRPDTIKIKGKKKQVTPDLVVGSRVGTDLYVVEQGTEYDIEKWRLLSLYAQKIRGNFYIIAPEENESHISKKLKESAISARIIYFSE